jgi:hypothetical protein
MKNFSEALIAIFCIAVKAFVDLVRLVVTDHQSEANSLLHSFAKMIEYFGVPFDIWLITLTFLMAAAIRTGLKGRVWLGIVLGGSIIFPFFSVMLAFAATQGGSAADHDYLLRSWTPLVVSLILMGCTCLVVTPPTPASVNGMDTPRSTQ